MSTGTLEREQTMARPKGRPRSSERADVTVKVNRALVSKAKMIAASQDRSLAELLSELLQTPIEEAFAKLAQQMAAASKPSKPEGPKRPK